MFERQLVFTSSKPVYLAFKPDDSFPAAQYGVLYRILRQGEESLKIRNPWPHYDLTGVDDPSLLDENMSREIVGEYLVSQSMHEWNNGHIKKGKALIDKAVQVADTHPAVLSLAADFLAQVKQLDRAESLYTKILELNPFLPICHIKMGIISFYKKDYHTAIQRFNVGLEQKGDAFLGTINRAMAFERLGDAESDSYKKQQLYKKALRDFEFVKQIDRSNPYVKAGISRVISKL